MVFLSCRVKGHRSPKVRLMFEDERTDVLQPPGFRQKYLLLLQIECRADRPVQLPLFAPDAGGSGSDLQLCV